MNPNIPDPSDGSDPPADGLLMLLAAAQEIERREALAAASDDTSNNLLSPQSSTSQASSDSAASQSTMASPTMIQTPNLTTNTPTMQPPESHTQKSSKRRSDAPDSLRPTKQARTEVGFSSNHVSSNTWNIASLEPQNTASDAHPEQCNLSTVNTNTASSAPQPSPTSNNEPHQEHFANAHYEQQAAGAQPSMPEPYPDHAQRFVNLTPLDRVRKIEDNICANHPQLPIETVKIAALDIYRRCTQRLPEPTHASAGTTGNLGLPPPGNGTPNMSSSNGLDPNNTANMPSNNMSESSPTHGEMVITQQENDDQNDQADNATPGPTRGQCPVENSHDQTPLDVAQHPQISQCQIQGQGQDQTKGATSSSGADSPKAEPLGEAVLETGPELSRPLVNSTPEDKVREIIEDLRAKFPKLSVGLLERKAQAVYLMDSQPLEQQPSQPVTEVAADVAGNPPQSSEDIREVRGIAEPDNSQADNPQADPFITAISDIATELPFGSKYHLTERELLSLGIQPNEDVLIALLLEKTPEPEDEDEAQQITNLKAPRKQDFFSLLGEHIELNLELAIHLDAQDLVSLYSISKDFHEAINGHLTHVMKSCATYRAPESTKAFNWRLYKSLCVKDPVGRTITTVEGNEEVRYVPSLKWLQMVYHRERVVRDILAMMARQGIRTPKGMGLTVKKIWLTMDISTSLRRGQLLHNEEYWTDQDLYNAQMFFMKLDMYFNDPIAGPGDDGMRKLILGQRGLTSLLRVMKREILTSHIEVLQWAVRYCYNPSEINKTYSILGVPPYEVGRGHREGWGVGRIHLYRPDELVMREAVRRNLDLESHLMNMMMWGYVDPITKMNIPVSEEEIYMSDDEEEDEIAEEMDELIMRKRQEFDEMAAMDEDWVEWYASDEENEYSNVGDEDAMREEDTENGDFYDTDLDIGLDQDS